MKDGRDSFLNNHKANRDTGAAGINDDRTTAGDRRQPDGLLGEAHSGKSRSGTLHSSKLQENKSHSSTQPTGKAQADKSDSNPHPGRLHADNLHSENLHKDKVHSDKASSDKLRDECYGHKIESRIYGSDLTSAKPINEENTIGIASRIDRLPNDPAWKQLRYLCGDLSAKISDSNKNYFHVGNRKQTSTAWVAKTAPSHFLQNQGSIYAAEHLQDAKPTKSIQPGLGLLPLSVHMSAIVDAGKNNMAWKRGEINHKDFITGKLNTNSTAYKRGDAILSRTNLSDHATTGSIANKDSIKSDYTIRKFGTKNDTDRAISVPSAVNQNKSDSFDRLAPVFKPTSIVMHENLLPEREKAGSKSRLTAALVGYYISNMQKENEPSPQNTGHEIGQAVRREVQHGIQQDPRQNIPCDSSGYLSLEKFQEKLKLTAVPASIDSSDNKPSSGAAAERPSTVERQHTFELYANKQVTVPLGALIARDLGQKRPGVVTGDRAISNNSHYGQNRIAKAPGTADKSMGRSLPEAAAKQTRAASNAGVTNNDAANNLVEHHEYITSRPLPERRYMVGVELALAAAIASAGLARARPNESSAKNDKEPLKVDDQQNLSDSQLIFEPTEANSHTKSKDRQKSAGNRCLVHLQIAIGTGDTLVSIAEAYFGDGNIAWLIADLNANHLKQSWLDGKRIIVIKNRQQLILPIWEEIVDFYWSRTRNCCADNLITVIEETEIDKEMVSTILGPVILGPNHKKANKKAK